MTGVLRIGILGAAPIAGGAIVRPGRRTSDVAVVAVAARDERRARRFAARHAIPRVHPSYAALIDDPRIDAVYVPLPNSLHATWTIRALQAGKHVLCEKPLASNAGEAERIADAARASGRVVMEAMHYRYHPLATRLKTIVDSGELGRIEHIEAEFSVPLLSPRSIHYRFDLGGGAAMDVGCYVVDLVRFLGGGEPRVIDARARLLRPQVDRMMTASLRFDDGSTARIRCALLTARGLRMSASVHGSDGSLHVLSPFLPHFFHRITVRSSQGVRHEQIAGKTTYHHQLAAFAAAVRANTPPPTSVANAIGTLRIIDALYSAAGLRVRGFRVDQ